MSAIVDYEFYTNVYMGQEADQASFPALCARASDVVGAMTRWVDVETLSDFQLTLYKKAICAQIDYFATNGLDSVAGGNDGRGWTVGKVSVNNGRYGSQTEHSGAMSAHISPMVLMYLEQSGLMNPAVPVVSRWC
jgi:hypothetical protein